MNKIVILIELLMIAYTMVKKTVLRHIFLFIIYQPTEICIQMGIIALHVLYHIIINNL